MSNSYTECPECHAVTGKHDEEESHRATCSKSARLEDADERIAELERRVEDLTARLEAVEAMVVP